MLSFYELAVRVGFDQVYYQRLLNWGMYTSEEYLQLDVANPSNIHNKELIDIVQELKTRSLSSPQLTVRFGAF